MPEDVDAVAVYQQLLEGRGTNGAGSTVQVRSLSAPRPAQPRVPTGIARLDELLGGGLPVGSATLLYGPPFTGKGVIQRHFFLRGLQSDEPSAFVLTDMSAPDMAERLSRMAPILRARSNGYYVDGYSRMIGEDASHPSTYFIDDLRGLVRITKFLDQIEGQLKPAGRIQRVVIQSLSTIMMEAGNAETFRFLRTLIGRVARRGGTILAGLEAGMHPEPEVQALKHLCTGMIQTREADERFSLRVEGLPAQYHPGWVEYEFSTEHVEVTGSFSSERIRGTAVAH